MGDTSVGGDTGVPGVHGGSMNETAVLVAVVAAIAVVVGGIAIIFFRRLGRRRRDAMARLADGAGALADKQGGHGDIEGVAFHYRYFAGSRNQPSFLDVWIDYRGRRALTVRPETGFDRFFKRLGIAVEVQTGERAFDRAYYIETDDPYWARQRMGDSALREAFTAILTAGFGRVAAAKAKLTARWSPCQLNDIEDPAVVRQAAERLVAIAAALAIGEAAPGISLAQGALAGRLVVLGAAAVSAAGGAVALGFGLVVFTPLDEVEVLLETLPWSVPAWFFFAFLAAMALRGRSGSHREWLVAVLIALPGAFLSGWGGVSLYNGWQDTSVPVVHIAPVDSKRFTSGKDRTYYVTVRSWRGRAQGEELSVPKRIYQVIDPRRTAMRLVVRDGALGYPWIESLAVVDGVDAGADADAPAR